VECSKKSLFDAILQSAQLGLECDGGLGQAFLVPFKDSVTLIPGYKGLLKLARNSGEVSTIQAHAVFENDEFNFSYGLHPTLDHKPTDGDPGALKAFYAVAVLKDGSTQFEVMWLRQVIEIRNRSKGYQAAKKWDKDTPWDTDLAEMGKKTVLRRLCKMLPSSTELARAVVLDEQAEAGLPQDLDGAIDIPASDITESGNGHEQSPASKLDALAEAGKTVHTAIQPPKQPESPRQPAQEQPKSTGKAKGKAEPTPAQNPAYADFEQEPDFEPGSNG
jgi:recombination protein RecT